MALKWPGMGGGGWGGVNRISEEGEETMLSCLWKGLMHAISSKANTGLGTIKYSMK